MKISVISTGSELLKGTTVNTNLAFLGQALTAAGFTPERGAIVPDSGKSMAEALASLVPISDIIITTGGLGPTSDDITRHVVCEFFGLNLKEDPALREKLEAHWQHLKRGHAPEALFSQARIPENAVVLENRNGTAPGLWLNVQKDGCSKIIILLPGPPSELEPMFTEEVIPKLETIAADRTFTERFMVAGAAELMVQQQAEAVIGNLPIELAYCASAEGVRVFLTGADHPLLKVKAAELKRIFGSAVLANDSLALAEEVSFLLRNRKFTLSTAESCTGGMIAAAITDLAGASDIFKGSVVAYSNEIKEKILDVPAEILNKHGAVSEECVAAMVDNICARFDTDTGIAVSGIAGPGGATPDKPPGLVFIGVRVKERMEVKKFNFGGSRDTVRRRAVANAFRMLRDLLIQQ
jgi:nicotinamide-nucleotide amidase